MRPKLECIGGPLDGDELFYPEEGDYVRVPAQSCEVPIRWVRFMVGAGCPDVLRVCIYNVEVLGEDIILRYWGE